jgi:hypothetical protein
MASKTTQPQAHLAVRVCDDPVITIFLSGACFARLMVIKPNYDVKKNNKGAALLHTPSL